MTDLDLEPDDAASPIELVLTWHTAVNAGDVETALALSRPDVAVGGPKGAAEGHDVLAAWIRDAGIRLEPVREWVEGDTVVVEQAASWPGRPDDDGRVQVAATVFLIEDGLIASVLRFPSVAEAAAAAGIEVDPAD